jgi:predicted ArsR family transcriptional regulator
LETLSQRGSLPIDEIARAARHSIIATRYHLTLLVNEGAVVVQNAVHTANVGRPQMLYALADRAHEHLPKQYASLAENLLDEISHTLSEKDKRALLRRAGKRLASSAPALRRGARIETRLERAVDFLSARGYLAHWEKSNSGFTLSVCNCPYRQVALAHREVCELDVALVGELIESPMKMAHCIANQDANCVFDVKPNANKK